MTGHASLGIQYIMKHLRLVIVILALFLGVRSEALSVISDLDDTVKITNVQNPWHFWNSLFSRKGFAAMPALYTSFMEQQNAQNLYILSASPKIIKFSINSFLRKNEYPPHILILKGRGYSDTYEYKVASIRAILNLDNEDYILIGDDTQKDPLVYKTISQEYPNRIHSVYIRGVMGKELPGGQFRFFSAYDIALLEYAMGTLAEANVLAVGQDLLSTEKDGLIIPRFAKCPPNSWLMDIINRYNLSGNVVQMAALVETRVMASCSTDLRLP